MISHCDSILYMVDFTFRARLYVLILMYLFSNQLALAAESSRAVHSFGKGRMVYGPQPLSVVTDFVTPSVSRPTFKSRWFISV